MTPPTDIEPIHVAVVEDDAEIAAVLVDMLGDEGYIAHRCGSLAELEQTVEQHAISLILLDLKLPDGDGLSIAPRIRANHGIPIIILSGKGSEIDRVVGLEIGADDYIVKPFSVREVAARIRAVLRRASPKPHATQPQPNRGYGFVGWMLDLERRRLTNPHGLDISLTVAEFDLLAALLSAQGRVLSRDQLLDLTRRENDSVIDRTIDVLILRLRRKIEITPGQPQLILTERAVGYMFGVNVEKIGSF